MFRVKLDRLADIGGLSFLAGVTILACLASLVGLPSLRGPSVISFLSYYSLAVGAYLLAVFRLSHDHLPLSLMWGFAILFRLVLLFTQPTLSDDVYRYIWDGHLFNQGFNPYALPVNSAALDIYNIPIRGLVNHAWMASPYMPAAQLYFAVVQWIAPQSVKAFQLAATVMDLLTGVLICSLLRRFDQPAKSALIYLWHPLVTIEFAHGAHLDAYMIVLVMMSLWLLARARHDGWRDRWLLWASLAAFGGAVLTKLVPILVAPLFVRRWGWKRVFVLAAALLAACAAFAVGAGWGLVGPLDGRGLFGALRIFVRWWNYNSGIYHWLEMAFSGYRTAGAVPVEVVGETPGLIARSVTTGALVIIIILTGLWAYFGRVWRSNDRTLSILRVIRLMVIGWGAYLLLTATVHPWYVTLIVALLPFLSIRPDGERPAGQSVANFMWPWMYFSLTLALSYLTYLDPDNLREFSIVRWIEYLPTYLLLIWAGLPLISRGRTSSLVTGTLWGRIKRQ